MAERFGQELVDVNITSNSRGYVLKVSVGSKSGPTVGDLTSITKEFRKYADSKGHEFIPFDYQLEISSPGIDRELREKRDFLWSEGRMLKVSANSGGAMVNYEGVLVRAEEEGIVLMCAEEERQIRFEDIVKAKQKIKF